MMTVINNGVINNNSNSSNNNNNNNNDNNNNNGNDHDHHVVTEPHHYCHNDDDVVDGYVVPLIPQHLDDHDHEQPQQPSLPDYEPQQPQPQSQQVLYDGIPSFSTSLLIKSLYFLDALGSSTWGRYSAIYYNLHSIKPSQIGVLESLRTLIPILSQPIWSFVADYYHCQKQVWIITKSCSTIILLGLSLPYIYHSYIKILVVSVSAQLFVSGGLLDAYTLHLLGKQHKRQYGKYRLWASIAWGLGSIAMGAFVDYYSFEWLFLMFGILAVIMIGLVTIFIPNDNENNNNDDESDGESNGANNSSTSNDHGNEDNTVQPHHQQQQQTQSRRPPHVCDLIRLVIYRPRVIIFLIEVIIMGAAMATVERLLFLYMVNDLESSTLLCGLSVGVNVIFELPIFWYTPQILHKYTHDMVFIVAMICFVVRVYGYTMLTPNTKWWILPLESLHGVTFSCFWIVTLDISKVLVHQTTPGSSNNGEDGFWKTAIPSTIQMLYNAVGVSIGVYVGGHVMERYGSRTMYRMTATMVFITLCIQIIGSVICRLQCTNGGGRGDDNNNNGNNLRSFLPSEDHNEDHHHHDHHGHDDDDDDDPVEDAAANAYQRLVDDDDDDANTNNDNNDDDDDYESLHLTRDRAFGIIENGSLCCN